MEVHLSGAGMATGAIPFRMSQDDAKRIRTKRPVELEKS
jgi:hypothetical protein